MPENRLKDLGTARAQQSREANDLAPANLERNVVEPLAPVRAMHREMVDLQHHLITRHGLLGKNLPDLAPHHGLEQKGLELRPRPKATRTLLPMEL